MQKMPSTGRISIVGAEGMKQLHRSSCIKIQARLLFLIFFILKKKRLCVFWGGLGKLNICHIRFRMVMLSSIFMCLQSSLLYGS